MSSYENAPRSEVIAAYRDLCRAEPSIPVFLRDWWLDATCGPDGWSVVTVEKGGQVQAALPFALKWRGPFTILSQPKLTPFLGPWIRDTGAKSANDLARQKDLMEALISGLPRHDHYQQNWSPSITNWLPFYWRGFQQSTGYTYRIEEKQSQEEIWAGFTKGFRASIARARDKHGVRVYEELNIDEFLAVCRKSYERQSIEPGFSDDYVRRIDSACSARDARKILIARDTEGRAHAGVFLVLAEDTVYSLMSGSDANLRNSGAGPMVRWEAIKFANHTGRSFDFTGSMMEPVERFFRSFGALQTPYMRVSRSPNRLLRLGLALKTAVSGT